jgi:hypothetical protein
MFSKIRWPAAMITATALETACVSYAIRPPVHSIWLALIYFLSGIAIALLALTGPELGAIRFRANTRSAPWYAFRILALLLMGIFVGWMAASWFRQIPIDTDYADMLPVIRVMDQRFLQGHWRAVYDPIPEIWGGIRPIYLPAMWLPFSLAELLHFDMRWISEFGIFFAFASFLLLLDPRKRIVASIACGLIGLVLLVWLHTEELSNLVSMTEEGVVLGYYALLVIAILSGKTTWIALTASLCLLSRFALSGWIPAFFLLLWLSGARKQALSFALILGSTILLLFILPFGWNAFARVGTLPGQYVHFAGRVWRDSPEFFSQGPGFAQFFGVARAALLHRWLVGLAITIPTLFAVGSWYLTRKYRIVNIPLATLKITLVLFYSFLDIPYLYLFYTSSIVSLLLLASLLRHLPKPSAAATKASR